MPRNTPASTRPYERGYLTFNEKAALTMASVLAISELIDLYNNPTISSASSLFRFLGVLITYTTTTNPLLRATSTMCAMVGLEPISHTFFGRSISAGESMILNNIETAAIVSSLFSA